MNATSPNSSRGSEDFSLWPPQFPSLNTILLFFFSTIVIIIARIWFVAEDPVEKRLRLREERKRKRKEERQKEGVKIEDETIDSLIDKALSEGIPKEGEGFVEEDITLEGSTGQITGMGEGTGLLKWTQNDAEVDIHIKMQEHTARKYIKCTLTAAGISLSLDERVVLSRKFWESIHPEGSNWQLEDPIKGSSEGEKLWGSVWIQLEKKRPAKNQGEWWKALLQEPKEDNHSDDDDTA